MNTPLKTLAALALALAAGSPALGADTPIPMGPPAPGQCVAGAPGCGDAAMTESAQNDMAVEQAKADERKMKDNGTYLSLTQTKDGGIFELADIDKKSGKHLWSHSDYVQGMCYMAKPLDDLLKDPSLPPAVRAAALEAQKQEKADADKKAADTAAKTQECNSLNPSPDCAKGHGFTALVNHNTPAGNSPAVAANNDATVAEKDPQPESPAPASADEPTDLRGLGNNLIAGNDNGDTGGAGAAPQTGGPTKGAQLNREAGAEAGRIAAEVSANPTGGIDPGAQGFVNGRKAAVNINGVLNTGTATLGDNVKKADDGTTRGGNTGFFGGH